MVYFIRLIRTNRCSGLCRKACCTAIGCVRRRPGPSW